MKNNQNKPTLLHPITQVEQQELEKIKDEFISKAMTVMNKNYNSELIPNILPELYPEMDNLQEIYGQLSDLKKCLDSFRPFNSSQMGNLQEVFDTEYTYESNRIEGNTLTLMETDLVINKGLTIDGKPLKDHFEAVNHLEAIEYIREVVKDKASLEIKGSE